jgi:hypothetical protein
MRRIHSKLRIVALGALLGGSALYAAGNANNQGITLPQGTVLHVRMIDSISSDRNSAGQMFRGSLDSPVVVHGRTVLPKGAEADVELVRTESAGKVSGRSELALRLARIRSGGKTYTVQSNIPEFRGSSQGKKTAKSAGIGALAGGGLGAIFGGGKGAAIGAGLGAGAGVATRAVKGGKPVSVGSESLVSFRLAAPLHVAG